MHSDGLERYRRQLAESVRAALEAVRPVLEAHQKFIADSRPTIEALGRVAEKVISDAEVAGDAMARTVGQVVQQFETAQRAIAPFLDQIAKAFEQLPPRQREALATLADDGWYIDSKLDSQELFTIADLFRRGDHTKARGLLCTHFDRRAEPLSIELGQRFPARARIISAAVAGHREANYALCIPALLAQADGVCVELVGVQLYARREGIPKLAAQLRVEERTPFIAALLHPLVTPTPISASAKERVSMSGGVFNRHAVLHGEISDYDTFANSCRAISLLAYVAWVLDKIRPTTAD
jgi:hypothetical protein